MRRQYSKGKRVLTVGVGDVLQKVRDVTKVGKVTRDIPAMSKFIGELAIVFLELHVQRYKNGVVCMCETETLLLTD